MHQDKVEKEPAQMTKRSEDLGGGEMTAGQEEGRGIVSQVRGM